MENPMQTHWWDNFYRKYRTKLWLGQAVGLLVILCLIPLSSSRFKRANNQVAPMVQDGEIVPVTSRELYGEIKISGKLDYGDGQIVHVTAPLAGRIERVASHSVGDPVTRGEELVSIKSDSLLDGKRDLFEALEAVESAKRNGDSSDTRSTKDSLSAARRKLLLLGVLPNELVDIEQSRDVDGPLAIDSRTAGKATSYTDLRSRIRCGCTSTFQFATCLGSRWDGASRSPYRLLPQKGSLP